MIKHLTFCFIALCVLFSSCIREEAPNAECDITGVDSAWLAMQLSDGLIKGSPRVGNQSVIFTLKGGADASAVGPIFTLTPGATISPDNGSVRDFTSPQIYTVTSQDRQWHKDYTVSFETSTTTTVFNFDSADVAANTTYYRFFETSPTDGSRQYIWGSGNAGFSFTNSNLTKDDYPTVLSTGGLKGNCAKLETKSTGFFGTLVGKRIAAGNLFIGSFDATNATSKPLEATKFGLPILESQPLVFKGFYKYTAGPKYINQAGVVQTGVTDSCDIYAVLYEIDPTNFIPLDGTNIGNSDRVVLRAQVKNLKQVTDWTQFTATFTLMSGKTYDATRMANDGYAFAIVATSSKDGANFSGAVGSVLYIDEFEIEVEK